MKKLFLALCIIGLLGGTVSAQSEGGGGGLAFNLGPAIYLDYTSQEGLDLLDMLRVGLTVDIIFKFDPMFGVGIDGGVYLGYASFDLGDYYEDIEVSGFTGEIGFIMIDIPAQAVFCIDLGGGLRLEALGGVLLWGMATPLFYVTPLIEAGARIIFNGLYAEADYVITGGMFRFGVGFLF